MVHLNQMKRASELTEGSLLMQALKKSVDALSLADKKAVLREVRLKTASNLSLFLCRRRLIALIFRPTI